MTIKGKRMGKWGRREGNPVSRDRSDRGEERERERRRERDKETGREVKRQRQTERDGRWSRPTF